MRRGKSRLSAVVEQGEINYDNLTCSDLQQVRGVYDIVLANIDIRTFKATSAHVMTLVKEGGYLVVSGILGRDRKELLSLFSSFSLIRMEQKNAWRGFVLQKKNA